MSEKGGASPAFIDEHDAGVESLCILPHGVVEIRFDSLNAFWAATPVGEETEAYEVRRHRAALRLDGLTSIAGQGVWVPKLSLGDGDIYDVAGERVWWSALLKPRSIHRIEFLFLTGDTLTLRANEAHLELEGTGDYLERWTGPFIGQPDSENPEGSA